ncbi:MAG: Sua5 family C-terminal domain-containing protein, partial [Acutalibacteraceae bacterium]
FVTVEELKSVCGEMYVDDAVLHPLKDGVKPASPGMKYTHYSPKAEVIILNGDSNAYCDYVNQNSGEKVFALCFDEDVSTLKVPHISYGGENDGTKQAERLFYSLRELDDMGARVIYARMPKADGVGLAVLNRLLRSAGFHVIDL